jgi:hypothetical protein
MDRRCSKLSNVAGGTSLRPTLECVAQTLGRLRACAGLVACSYEGAPGTIAPVNRLESGRAVGHT